MAARRRRRRRNRTKIWRAPWWWAFEIHHFPEQLFFCPAAAAMLASLVVRLQAGTSQQCRVAGAASEGRFMSLLGEHWKSLKPLIET